MPLHVSPSMLVGEAMHRGVISVPPQTPVLEAAARMHGERVHCVVVQGLTRSVGGQEELVWGILSDVDLMKAAAAGLLDASAGAIAATEILTVEEDDPVELASRIMAEHERTHLVVVSRAGEPVGVLSTLDIAGVLARPQALTP